MDVHVPSLDITSLGSINRIQAKIKFTNMDLSFSHAYFPTKLIHLNINDIQSKETTPEEKDLAHFTIRNMKRLSTWDEWEKC